MSKTDSPHEAARRDRLRAALRENLKRRKAQAKAKANTAAQPAETRAQTGNAATEPGAGARGERR
jgi:hypothetical protein